MELLKQLRIAVVGMPDSGKSTFISAVVRALTGRAITPDTLMREVHWSDGKDPSGNPDTRTIKCAKIQFPYKDIEVLLYDCPGHLEYGEQIRQGIEASAFIIKIADCTRLDASMEYLESIKRQEDSVLIFSHSNENKPYHYNVESETFKYFAEGLFDSIYSMRKPLVDIEREALQLTGEIVPLYKRPGMCFSGGKDSLVGMHLLMRAGLLNNVRVYYPYSGNDFEQTERAIYEYARMFKTEITRFSNNGGLTPDAPQFAWVSAKAKANTELIEREDVDLLLVQYRASDEGVRSKDYHLVQKGNHYRFSPVFYFSEENIWRYIAKYNLPVCQLYYEGFRSLGDQCNTRPCMTPAPRTTEEIINYIRKHPLEAERSGRKAQDNATPFAMEKLRDNGFF